MLYLALLAGTTGVVCVFCPNEKGYVFQKASDTLNTMLSPDGDVGFCNISKEPALEAAISKITPTSWPHKEMHKKIAFVTMGAHTGICAVGFGNTKKQCERAAKLALSIALALHGPDYMGRILLRT